MRLLALLWLALSILPQPAASQSALEVSGLPADAPVTVSAYATAWSVVVDLDFDPEWHAYSRDVGGGEPVRLVIDETSGFRAAGPLVAPDHGDARLSGQVRLTMRIAGDGDARRLSATLDLQVCDPLQCLPPMTVGLSGEVGPISVLLVAAARDARTERIAAFLGERGFDVAVDTYAEVSAEACDARDVVIADSNLFRQTGVAIDVVRRFPRTTSPLIAVGFLGTELVEAQGIAMTSGYI